MNHVYVAGPMTGYPQFNIPAFDVMAALLRELGFQVTSPAELDDPEVRAISLASPDGAIATLNSHGKTWGDFLARDIKLIADGDIEGIVVLPGWQRSSGARLETFVGRALKGMPVYTLDDRTLFRVPDWKLVVAWAGILFDDMASALTRYSFRGIQKMAGEL